MNCLFLCTLRREDICDGGIWFGIVLETGTESENVLLFILMVFFCFRVCVIVVGQISTCANNFSRERESMYL